MSAIPTQFPVTMTDGTTEYQVHDASSYVNAVYSLGHRPQRTARPTAAESNHK
ncbi:hypothetical protein ACFO5K_12540 [Nocardia halotolerans]|uniref:Uncharacterized protein n=1 Tax=Nocardia halotolerans TaxID=1755878 RepID=A0ABV8VHH1_9NOCA